MNATTRLAGAVRIEKETHLPGYYVTVGGDRPYWAGQDNAELSWFEANKLAQEIRDRQTVS